MMLGYKEIILNINEIGFTEYEFQFFAHVLC